MIFYRGDDVYNTTYFPWGTLIYYTLMNIIGHFYVNTSNLNFERKHILYTNSTKYRDFLLVPLFAPIFFMISSIIVLRSQNDLASSGEEPFTTGNIMLFNLCVWTTAYFVGLQFTHFDKGPMQHFSLTPDKIKKWPKMLFIIFGVVVVVVLGIAAYLITMYVFAGVFWWYLGWFCLIIAGFVIPTLIWKKTHTIHIHHYTCGMILIVLVGY